MPPAGWRAALKNWWRPALFLSVAVVLAGVTFHFRHDLTFKQLAHRQQVIHEFQSEHPLLTLAIVIAAYVVTTGLFLPLSIPHSLLCGWLFGFWGATAIASFANVGGCTMAMLISRYFLRGTISGHYKSALGEKARPFCWLSRDGVLYLLSLRLVHVIPSWLINLLLGWTDIRVPTFWWATQLGNLPGTLLYAYVGAHIPSLDEMHRIDWAEIITPLRLVGFVPARPAALGDPAALASARPRIGWPGQRPGRASDKRPLDYATLPMQMAVSEDRCRRDQCSG